MDKILFNSTSNVFILNNFDALRIIFSSNWIDISSFRATNFTFQLDNNKFAYSYIWIFYKSNRHVYRFPWTFFRFSNVSNNREIIIYRRWINPRRITPQVCNDVESTVNIIINRGSLLSRYTCLASLCRVPCDWWILFASRPRNRIFLCQLYAYYASCIYAVCWKYYQQRRPIKRSRPDRRNIAPFGFASTREGNTTFSRAKLESFDSSVRIRESNWIETSPRRHARNWFNYRCSCESSPICNRDNRDSRRWVISKLLRTAVFSIRFPRNWRKVFAEIFS